jgi:hypothetical protein
MELFLDFLSNPEEGGDMYLRNVGLISKDYNALCLRRYGSL